MCRRKPCRVIECMCSSTSPENNEQLGCSGLAVGQHPLALVGTFGKGRAVGLSR